MTHDVNGFSLSTQRCGLYPNNQYWSFSEGVEPAARLASVTFSNSKIRPFSAPNKCLDGNDNRNVYLINCKQGPYQNWAVSGIYYDFIYTYTYTFRQENTGFMLESNNAGII